MRLNQLAIAFLCSVALVAPALAQPATAPATRSAAPAVPMTTAPMATPAPRATAPVGAMPAPAAKTPTAAASATMGPTNINTASAAELDKLPQIGKARAAKIISNRPYKTPDELVSKKAISQGVYNKIKDRVTTG